MLILQDTREQKKVALSFPVEGLFVGTLPNFRTDQFSELTNSSYLSLAFVSVDMSEYTEALPLLQSIDLPSYTDHCALLQGEGLYYSHVAFIKFKKEDCNMNV